MILRGANIENNVENLMGTQTALSIAQLIMYNCSFRRIDKQKSASYHMREKETPLVIYLALFLHAKSRKKGIIEEFSSLGVCVPYSRVLEILTQTENQFTEENVVCLVDLNKTYLRPLQ